MLCTSSLRLDRHRLPMSPKPLLANNPKITDVARLAGVSVTTVSMVLDRKSVV